MVRKAYDHKAFEVVGQRVLIDTGEKQKLGIFQESRYFKTTLEGGRPALDLIEPVYNTSPGMEELAKGKDPRERVNPQNPILSLHMGIDHPKLRYRGMRDGAHVFDGELDYVQGSFVNDGNTEIYDRYRSALRNAGFEIE